MHRKGIRTIDDIEQTIAYESGSQLEGINFAKRPDGWLCILKVRTQQGKHMVSFIHAHDIESCLDIIDAALHTTAVNLKWRPDKWKEG